MCALGLAAGLAVACGDAGAPGPHAAPDKAPKTSPAPSASTAPPQETTPAAAKPTRKEQPLPAFEGSTLSGERLSVSTLLGKRLVLFFFNPEVPEAAIAAKAVSSIAKLQGEQNFRIVGVGEGADRKKIESFVRREGLDFPVIDDATGGIAQKLGLRVPVALLGADAEGYVIFGLGGFSTDIPEPARAIEAQLRSALRLPTIGGATEVALGDKPKAPEFSAVRLAGGEPFKLAAARGKPVLLMFFLHTCPHCHHALEFLKSYLPTIPEDKRPLLVGISVSDRADAVETALKSDGLDFFPVLLDPDFKVREAYGVLAGVPDTFLIDGEGRIVSRTQGWRDDRDPPLLKMRIAKTAGIPVPMLLHQTGFSGNEFCGVCHTTEDETWELTKHATAFQTLVTHGADKNSECVGCHVVGWNKPGGYTITPPTPSLENVGCENCHGRGGPHLTPGLVKDGNYEPQCLVCHDPKHSLGFEYAKFLPKVSHAENAKLLSLPLEEKRKILVARGKLRTDLLPTTAPYVGSQACESCHAAEYATWKAGPHARAADTLAKKGKADEANCLKCHTTGYGRTGGFPAGGKLAAHTGLAGVGCESCHGPGGDHVQSGDPKKIVSLGDKCDSCVILQICGSCHDDVNDPGFEFEVKQKIEAQKHGTKPPSASPGPDKSAATSQLGGGAEIGAVEGAFRALDRES